MGDDFIKGDGEIYVETNYMFLKNHSSHHQESPILFQVKHHTKNDTGKINRVHLFDGHLAHIPHAAKKSQRPSLPHTPVYSMIYAAAIRKALIETRYVRLIPQNPSA